VVSEANAKCAVVPPEKTALEDPVTVSDVAAPLAVTSAAPPVVYVPPTNDRVLAPVTLERTMVLPLVETLELASSKPRAENVPSANAVVAPVSVHEVKTRLHVVSEANENCAVLPPEKTALEDPVTVSDVAAPLAVTSAAPPVVYVPPTNDRVLAPVTLERTMVLPLVETVDVDKVVVSWLTVPKDNAVETPVMTQLTSRIDEVVIEGTRRAIAWKLTLVAVMEMEVAAPAAEMMTEEELSRQESRVNVLVASVDKKRNGTFAGALMVTPEATERVSALMASVQRRKLEPTLKEPEAMVMSSVSAAPIT
jgi:hypothetical protein